jgi:hypothetical protein
MILFECATDVLKNVFEGSLPTDKQFVERQLLCLKYLLQILLIYLLVDYGLLMRSLTFIIDLLIIEKLRVNLQFVSQITNGLEEVVWYLLWTCNDH